MFRKIHVFLTSDKLAPRGFEARIVGYISTFGIYHVMEKSRKIGITENPIPAGHEIGESEPTIGESEREQEFENKAGESEPVIGESKSENKAGEDAEPKINEPKVGEDAEPKAGEDAEPKINEPKAAEDAEPKINEPKAGEDATGESFEINEPKAGEDATSEIKNKLNEPKEGKNVAKRPRKKATDWLDELGECKSKRERRPTRKVSTIIQIAAVSGNNPDHVTDAQTRNCPEVAEWAKARSQERE